MSAEREEESEVIERPAEVSRPRPAKDPEAKPAGIDPQIKAVLDEMRRVDLEHKDGWW